VPGSWDLIVIGGGAAGLGAARAGAARRGEPLVKRVKTGSNVGHCRPCGRYATLKFGL
jgi:thioredoxin reductase